MTVSMDTIKITARIVEITLRLLILGVSDTAVPVLFFCFFMCASCIGNALSLRLNYSKQKRHYPCKIVPSGLWL